MKSLPKSNEMPPSTGSKTPASGKKLVQARLPFKTLGGSEPPITATNETSETAPITPKTDSRKRRQSAAATKEDGVRAAKVNRSDNEDPVVLVTTETMDISNDLPSDTELDNCARSTLSHNSESKENVCVDKIDADAATLNDGHNEIAKTETYAPKAKQSLEFEEERSEPRRSKRDTSLITIKIPMGKKSKKAKKLKKSEQNAAKNEVTPEETENEPQDISLVEDAEEASTSKENDLISDVEELDASTLNESILSNVSEQCTTPANHKITPKQMQRRIESEKKKLEKEQARVDRERKLQREKDERESQKKREREEKGKN